MSASATQGGHKKTFLHLWFTAMFSSHFLVFTTLHGTERGASDVHGRGIPVLFKR